MLKRSLENTQSPEVAYRLKLILKTIPKEQEDTISKDIRLERVIHILKIIGSDAAEKLREKLSDVIKQ